VGCKWQAGARLLRTNRLNASRFNNMDIEHVIQSRFGGQRTLQELLSSLEFAEKAFKRNLKGNEETKSVRVIYSGISAAPK